MPKRVVREVERNIGLLVIENVKRKSKKIPAVTIAAAWSKALTVVGAVIESTNQLLKGSWADLVKAAIRKDKETD